MGPNLKKIQDFFDWNCFLTFLSDFNSIPTKNLFLNVDFNLNFEAVF